MIMTMSKELKKLVEERPEEFWYRKPRETKVNKEKKTPKAYIKKRG